MLIDCCSIAKFVAEEVVCVLLSWCLLFRNLHAGMSFAFLLLFFQLTLIRFPQILVPVADGSEEMEAVIIIDVLRRAKAKVVVASVGDKLEIVASRRAKLVADTLLDEAVKNSYDLIVLPVRCANSGGPFSFAIFSLLFSRKT